MKKGQFSFFIVFIQKNIKMVLFKAVDLPDFPQGIEFVMSDTLSEIIL